MNNPAQQDILSQYRDKSVLVTGAGGFVGGSLVHALAGAANRIIRLARTRLPVLEQGDFTMEDVIGDVRDAGTWKKVLDGVDVVFHFAAQTSVYAAAEDPVSDLRTNVEGILGLLEGIRKAGIHPIVVFAGTVTEAGLTERLPVDESAPDRPITVYDLSKLTAENYLKLYIRQGWLRGASLRLANVYGPGPKASGSDRSVLNKVIQQALEGKEVFVFGDGGYTRDYLFIDDAVNAFLLAGVNPENVNGRHFIIGSGCGVALKDAFALAVKQVAAKTGRKVCLSHKEPPQGMLPIEFRSFVADPSAFINATGWRPQVDLREGIGRAIDAMRAMHT